MAADLATLTVAAQPSRVGSCELCTTTGVVLAATALVRHSRGGSVQLAACDRCARAVRRLAAALGAGALVEPPVVIESPPAAVAVLPVPVAPAAVAHGRPQLVSRLASEVVSGDGRRWSVRVYGEPRADGTWVGWLEFDVVGGDQVVRTRQETSQPDRGALEYWATGLQGSYLEGAFNRARQP